MEAFMIILFLIAFLGYFVSIALGIILLVKLIQMGIACIKLGNYASRDRIKLADRHSINVLWGWVLALSIFFATMFILFFIIMGEDAVFGAIGFVFPAFYLNPQIAVLVAGKIISGRYSNAFARYKAWEHKQKEAAVAPVFDAVVSD